MRLVALALATMLTGCGGGGGGESQQVQPEQPLAAPTGVTITAEGNSAVISWNPVNGAAGYHVYYSTEPTLDPDNYAIYANSAWVRNVQSPLAIDNLGQGPIYYFLVTAYKGTAESQASAVVKAVTRYRFTGGNSELVQDAITGLDWKRCVVGMTWNNSTNRCDGVATILNSNDSLAYSVPDVSGWRLPTIYELQSIMYWCLAVPVHQHFCETTSPLIHQATFPNTPYSRSYFTSDQLAGYPGVYLKLDFNSGGIAGTPASSSTQSFVRLVRSTP